MPKVNDLKQFILMERQQRNNLAAFNLLAKKEDAVEELRGYLNSSNKRSNILHIDDFKYGQPSDADLKLMTARLKLLQTSFDELSLPKPFKNSAEETGMELKFIRMLRKLSEDPNTIRDIEEEDKDLISPFLRFAEANHLPVDEHFLRILLDDVNSIAMRFKYMFNRPRPQQLATQRDLELVTRNSESANTPSYPSAHTVAGRVIGKALGDKYPDFADEFEKIGASIGLHRLIAGLHYPTDHAAGVMLGDQIYTKGLVKDHTNFMMPDAEELVHAVQQAIAKHAEGFNLNKSIDDMSVLVDIFKAEGDTPKRHIYVFGSNLDGKNYGGAAKHAWNFGASRKGITGDAEDRIEGDTYSLPTKISMFKRNVEGDQYMTGDEINDSIRKFVDFAFDPQNDHMVFHIANVGTDKGGHDPIDIAGMFDEALDHHGITEENAHEMKDRFLFDKGNTRRKTISVDYKEGLADLVLEGALPHDPTTFEMPKERWSGTPYHSMNPDPQSGTPQADKENNVHTRSGDPILAALSNWTTQGNRRWDESGGKEGTPNKYPVKIDGVEYQDLEEYYGLKLGGGNFFKPKKTPTINEDTGEVYTDEEKIEVMAKAMIAKFKQYPELAEAIRTRAGVSDNAGDDRGNGLGYIAGLEHYYPANERPDGTWNKGSRKPRGHEPGWEGRGAQAWHIQALGRAFGAIEAERFDPKNPDYEMNMFEELMARGKIQKYYSPKDVEELREEIADQQGFGDAPYGTPILNAHGFRGDDLNSDLEEDQATQVEIIDNYYDPDHRDHDVWVGKMGMLDSFTKAGVFSSRGSTDTTLKDNPFAVDNIKFPGDSDAPDVEIEDNHPINQFYTPKGEYSQNEDFDDHYFLSNFSQLKNANDFRNWYTIGDDEKASVAGYMWNEDTEDWDIQEDERHPTVEHAFQASKFTDPKVRKQILEASGAKGSPSPWKAKKIKDGNEDKLAISNRGEAADELMRLILRDKFMNNKGLARQLLETKTKDLREGNRNPESKTLSRGDHYWGNSGNRLGHMLEDIRGELSEKYPPGSSDDFDASEEWQFDTLGGEINYDYLKNPDAMFPLKEHFPDGKIPVTAMDFDREVPMNYNENTYGRTFRTIKTKPIKDSIDKLHQDLLLTGKDPDNKAASIEKKILVHMRELKAAEQHNTDMRDVGSAYNLMLAGDGNYRTQSTRLAEQFDDTKIGDVWGIRDPDHEGDAFRGFLVEIIDIIKTENMGDDEWGNWEGWSPKYYHQGEPERWVNNKPEGNRPFGNGEFLSFRFRIMNDPEIDDPNIVRHYLDAKDNYENPPEVDLATLPDGEYTNHTGNAKGTDIYAAKRMREEGLTGEGLGRSIGHSFNGHDMAEGHSQYTDRVIHNNLLTDPEVGSRTLRAYSRLASRGGQRSMLNDSKLIHRNWHQIVNAQGVYAVVDKFQPDEDGKPIHGDGGTGWGIAMAQGKGIPVHAFDQTTNQWYTWDNSDNQEWVRTSGDLPAYQDHAFIGTRQLKFNGERAIDGVVDNLVNRRNQYKNDNKPYDDPVILQTPNDIEADIRDEETILAPFDEQVKAIQENPDTEIFTNPNLELTKDTIPERVIEHYKNIKLWGDLSRKEIEDIILYRDGEAKRNSIESYKTDHGLSADDKPQTWKELVDIYQTETRQASPLEQPVYRAGEGWIPHPEGEWVGTGDPEYRYKEYGDLDEGYEQTKFWGRPAVTSSAEPYVLAALNRSSPTRVGAVSPDTHPQLKVMFGQQVREPHRWFQRQVHYTEPTQPGSIILTQADKDYVENVVQRQNYRNALYLSRMRGDLELEDYQRPKTGGGFNRPDIHRGRPYPEHTRVQSNSFLYPEDVIEPMEIDIDSPYIDFEAPSFPDLDRVSDFIDLAYQPAHYLFVNTADFIKLVGSGKGRLKAGDKRKDVDVKGHLMEVRPFGEGEEMTPTMRPMGKGSLGGKFQDPLRYGEYREPYLSNIEYADTSKFVPIDELDDTARLVRVIRTPYTGQTPEEIDNDYINREVEGDLPFVDLDEFNVFSPEKGKFSVSLQVGLSADEIKYKEGWNRNTKQYENVGIISQLEAIREMVDPTSATNPMGKGAYKNREIQNLTDWLHTTLKGIGSKYRTLGGSSSLMYNIEGTPPPVEMAGEEGRPSEHYTPQEPRGTGSIPTALSRLPSQEAGVARYGLVQKPEPSILANLLDILRTMQGNVGTTHSGVRGETSRPKVSQMDDNSAARASVDVWAKEFLQREDAMQTRGNKREAVMSQSERNWMEEEDRAYFNAFADQFRENHMDWIGSQEPSKTGDIRKGHAFIPSEDGENVVFNMMVDNEDGTQVLKKVLIPATATTKVGYKQKGTTNLDYRDTKGMWDVNTTEGMFPDQRQRFLDTAWLHAHNDEDLRRHYMTHAMWGTWGFNRETGKDGIKTWVGGDGKTRISSLAPYLANRITDLQQTLREQLFTKPTDSIEPPDPKSHPEWDDITDYDNEEPPEQPRPDAYPTQAEWGIANAEWSAAYDKYEERRELNEIYHEASASYDVSNPNGRSEWNRYYNANTLLGPGLKAIDALLLHPDVWGPEGKGGDITEQYGGYYRPAQWETITKEKVFERILLNDYSGVRALQNFNKVRGEVNSGRFKGIRRDIYDVKPLSIADVVAFGDALAFKDDMGDSTITGVFKGENPSWGGYSSGTLTDDEEEFFQENPDFATLVRGLATARKEKLFEITETAKFDKLEADRERQDLLREQEGEEAAQRGLPKPDTPYSDTDVTFNKVELEEITESVDQDLLDTILEGVDSIEWDDGGNKNFTAPVTQADLAILFTERVNNSVSSDEYIKGYGKAKGEKRPLFRQTGGEREIAQEQRGAWERILYDGEGKEIGTEPASRSEVDASTTGSFRNVPRFKEKLVWGRSSNRGIESVDALWRDIERHTKLATTGQGILTQAERDHIEDTVTMPIFDEFYGSDVSREEIQRRLRPDSPQRQIFMDRIRSGLNNYMNEKTINFSAEGKEERWLDDEGEWDDATTAYRPLKTVKGFEVGGVPLPDTGTFINTHANLSHLYDRYLAESGEETVDAQSLVNWIQELKKRWLKAEKPSSREDARRITRGLENLERDQGYPFPGSSVPYKQSPTDVYPELYDISPGVKGEGYGQRIESAGEQPPIWRPDPERLKGRQVTFDPAGMAAELDRMGVDRDLQEQKWTVDPSWLEEA